MTVALVHVPGEGRWLRISEPHTTARIAELRRYAMAFDDGFYIARMYAERDGYMGLRRHGFSRRTAAGYYEICQFLGDYTDDEVLAARVALEIVGPARGSIWESVA